MQKITIGRIIEFFPNGNEYNPLPNNMQSAPAIVVQEFNNGAHVNLQLFTAASDGKTQNAWTVCHKDDVPLVPESTTEAGGLMKGISYWDWLPRV